MACAARGQPEATGGATWAGSDGRRNKGWRRPWARGRLEAMGGARMARGDGRRDKGWRRPHEEPRTARGGALTMALEAADVATTVGCVGISPARGDGAAARAFRAAAALWSGEGDTCALR